ncbi:acylneuraminate cytidylyltransferase family protein [Chitinimonas arctica]|nr:acylneuraminate cytidylyltransferase family protein [Chitinimonas arctica]
MRVLAVIPARGGSKRLPGKNTRPLFDKPLIAWTISFAQTIPWFSDIQLSTDSAEIAEVGRHAGLDVSRLRPAELAQDKTASLDVVLELLDYLSKVGREFDAVALLQPTTPVRFQTRWQSAFDLLAEEDCDGVIGVSMASTHPYLAYREGTSGCLEAWVDNSTGITRSQDYPPAYAVNGALYLTKVRTLREQGTFTPKRCRSVLCSEAVENIDIDTLFDWRVAELLIDDWMKTK